MSKTTIEWASHTWNPYTWNCNKVSQGCKNCYAEALATRLGRYAGTSFLDTPQLRASAYAELKTFKPGSVIFVNSMSDTYHESAKLEWIHSIHNTAAANPHLVFLLLTKRPERALALSSYLTYPENLWVGTSVEHADYLWRLDYLLKIPASGHFVSAEPLLGGLPGLPEYLTPTIRRRGLKWVIVGAESGANRRAFNLQWAREIRDMCQQANVPFMFKQGSHFKSGQERILDGRTWDETPVFVEPVKEPMQPKAITAPLPKQLKFTGNGFDRHEWLNPKDAGTQKAPPVERWEYCFPWLDKSGKVWVWNGWKEGKKHYVLADRNSPIGEKQRVHLEGSSVFSVAVYRDELLEFLYRQVTWQFETIRDIGDLPALTTLPAQGETKKETVDIARIVPTQRSVNRWHVHVYATSNPMRKDARGNLPFGVRFADSDDILLMDGHHRLAADKWRGKGVFELDVQDYACTFEQACGLIADEDDGDDFLADVLEEVVAILAEREIACHICQGRTPQMWAKEEHYYCVDCWSKSGRKKREAAYA
jgi:protein gp37